MRKIPLIIGVLLLLGGLGTVAGMVTLEFYTTKEWSATRTLEGPLGIEWMYGPIDISAGETVKITVTCTEADDQVFLGLMTEAVFEAGGPWTENQFLAYIEGRLTVWVSFAPEAPAKATYYWIVQGIGDTWPISFNVTTEVKTSRDIAPYFGTGLIIVGAILIALSWYRAKR